MRKILRSEARKLGRKRYFTGVACKNAHVSERNTSTGQCLKCCRSKDKRRRDSLDPTYAAAKRKDRHLKTMYGIDLAEKMEMAESQDHRCKCCGTPDTALKVDHDHTSGKVRGLLCNNCNSMLGYALDNPKRLELGIAYLEKF